MWERADLARFAFPFPTDHYRYGADVEPATGPRYTLAGEYGEYIVDVDRRYSEELELRELVLAADPTRCQIPSRTADAAWDALLTLLDELADADPRSFSLQRGDRDTYIWRNHVRGIVRAFRYGDEESLGEPPLLFAARNVQEDILLLDERDGELRTEAGVVTFASAWAGGLTVGVPFDAFPVRRGHGDAYRRVDWTLTAGRALDLSPERYAATGVGRGRPGLVGHAETGRHLHLRVELSHTIRLPRSGAAMLLIRTQLLPLEAIATIPAWGRRLLSVLQELPEDLAERRGMARLREPAVAWLRQAVQQRAAWAPVRSAS